MDGAALVLGMLLEEGILTTKRNAKYRDNLETMIQQYLLPLFQSPYGFLRAKACWLSSKFADNCSFRQADGSKARGAGPLFDKLFSDNLQCMHDRCVACPVARPVCTCWFENLAASETKARGKSGMCQGRTRTLWARMFLHFDRTAWALRAQSTAGLSKPRGPARPAEGGSCIGVVLGLCDGHAVLMAW